MTERTRGVMRDFAFSRELHSRAAFASCIRELHSRAGVTVRWHCHTFREIRVRTRMKPTGTIKHVAADFVVDEIPSYLPSGQGEHLYIHLQKTGWATDELARWFARELRLLPRDVGVAGMKDKHAVTTQYLSFPVPPRTPDFDAEVARLVLPAGVTILSAARHGNKLRTGHLRGNRFSLRVRNVAGSAFSQIESAFRDLEARGVANHFGAQRFGHGGRNAEAALAFLRGDKPAPRDGKQARFLFSALQSTIFNAVLDARLQDDTWATALLGDLLTREARVLGSEDERGRGAMFVCDDPETDSARAARGEVSPTGPMPGAEMREPTGVVHELETRVTRSIVGENFSWEAARRLGEGTRRPLRLWLEDLQLRQEPQGSGGKPPDESLDHASVDSVQRCPESPMARAQNEELSDICVSFVLPKGSYATTVLAAVFQVEESGRGGLLHAPEGSDLST
jgi:tRNA pseudouridine13 synthase